jgi:hypothetical protein
MPSPDAWDTLPSDELRDLFATHRPQPSVELRTRVADVLAAPVAPPRRRRAVPRRRLFGGLALATACVAAVAVAVSLGQGGSAKPTASHVRNELPVVDHGAVPGPERVYTTAGGGAGAVGGSVDQSDNGGLAGQGGATISGSSALDPSVPAAPVPTITGPVPTPSGSRLQDYRTEIHLRVQGTKRLSQVTQRAISLTRGYGGYVTVSNVTLHGSSGTAQVDVHVPVAKVQDAIARFSSLGVIVGQHVAVTDLQAGFDAAARRIESLRHSLALIDVRLAAPRLTPERRVTLLAQQERARHALAGAQETSAGLAARGAYARIDLTFATAPRHVAAAVVQRPGRLEHALRRAGGMLETAAIGAIYVAVLGGPLLVVALLVLLGLRRDRRRREQALLERA